MSRDKVSLVEWHGDPDKLSMQNLDDWYLGGTVHRVPTKKDVARDGIKSLLEGWLPLGPMIDASTRVIGVGSRFRPYFIPCLTETGFNKSPDSSPYKPLVGYGATFYRPAVI